MKIIPQSLVLLTLMLSVLATLGAEPPAPLQADFGDAILRQWVQPEYPEAARLAKLEGKVVVEFVVEADGKVTRTSVKNSTDQKFDASALAAVQNWTFDAATAEGKSVASGMEVPIVFKLAQLHQKNAPATPPLDQMPVAFPIVPAKLKSTPTPGYPEELADRRLPGQVVLEFTIETDGRPQSPKVLWSPHAAFVGEALKALAKYQFQPSHQGPLLLPSGPTKGQMEFESLGATRAELLAINHLTVLDAQKFRDLPNPAVLPEPVYPYALLLAGESGSATVNFTVTDHGAVSEILLKDASRPEFGAALIAAIEASAFDAALIGTDPAPAKMVVTYTFVPPAGGELNRLMVALQPGGPGVAGARGLDERLRPIWRVSPVYPDALRVEKPVGKTMIEFIIDREGRCRLPRVVSASQPEFGWAAAAAINQWVFARPMKGGQPVDVKVDIPVDFPPPKN
ncbi:MAG: TonB family protein [Lacunisphaera sp.]